MTCALLFRQQFRFLEGVRLWLEQKWRPGVIKIFLGAFAALALIPTDAFAVATTATACGAGSWTDLGSGPMLIQVTSSSCKIAIADVNPTTSTAGFALGSEPFDYTGSSHLWARGGGFAITGR
jgi:hypothetical protein